MCIYLKPVFLNETLHTKKGKRRMHNTSWKSHGPYEGMYEKFHKVSQDATGYDFEKGPSGNVSPPTMKRSNLLNWWSLDRPKRLISIRCMRARFLHDILRLRGLEESAKIVSLDSVLLTEGTQRGKCLHKEYGTHIQQKASKEELVRVVQSTQLGHSQSLSLYLA